MSLDDASTTEIRHFAETVLLSDDLDLKLRRCRTPFVDTAPGVAVRIEVPGRPAHLPFAPRRTAPGMPGAEALREPQKRAIAHHIMANHELQACEVMAFVLLAFPDAPSAFREGLARIIDDEQRHTRMHAERAAALGQPFGSLPVNCYIWKQTTSYQSVLDYLAGLPLTFENANLDHTIEFEAAFLAAGDERGAAVMRRIHEDEIEHVRFGLEWLRKLKGAGQSDWEAFAGHLHWPMRPAKAKGDTFHRGPRVEAGMDSDFLDRLEHAPFE
ncbi:MAG: DUF455 family protein [Planctomycetaceae bacterium]|nr:DUF455 family protein [Planctomycetaceae bacterium]